MESVESEDRVDSEAKVMESESEGWKWTVTLDMKESEEEEESRSGGGEGSGKRLRRQVLSVLKYPLRPRVIISINSGSMKDENCLVRPWKKDRRHWTLV